MRLHQPLEQNSRGCRESYRCTHGRTAGAQEVRTSHLLCDGVFWSCDRERRCSGHPTAGPGSGRQPENTSSQPETPGQLDSPLTPGTPVNGSTLPGRTFTCSSPPVIPPVAAPTGPGPQPRGPLNSGLSQAPAFRPLRGNSCADQLGCLQEQAAGESRLG